MNTSEIKTLIEYNRWANQRLFRKVKQLEDPQLFLPGQVGPNSVFEALLHILDGEYFWRLAVQTGLGPTERLSVEKLPDLEGLLIFWQQEANQLSAYVDGLKENDLGAEFEYRWGSSKTRRWIRWQCLIHIVNHGTQHRGELGLVLGHLGHSPGSLDLVTFVARQAVKSKLRDS